MRPVEISARTCAESSAVEMEMSELLDCLGQVRPGFASLLGHLVMLGFGFPRLVLTCGSALLLPAPRLLLAWRCEALALRLRVVVDFHLVVLLQPLPELGHGEGA